VASGSSGRFERTRSRSILEVGTRRVPGVDQEVAETVVAIGTRFGYGFRIGQRVTRLACHLVILAVHYYSALGMRDLIKISNNQEALP
jgi:hypothetical protein